MQRHCLIPLLIALAHIITFGCSCPTAVVIPSYDKIRYHFNNTALQYWSYHGAGTGQVFPFQTTDPGSVDSYFNGDTPDEVNGNDVPAYTLRYAENNIIANTSFTGPEIYNYLWPQSPRNQSNSVAQLGNATLQNSMASTGGRSDYILSNGYNCDQPSIKLSPTEISTFFSEACSAMSASTLMMDAANIGPSKSGRKLTAGVTYQGYDPKGSQVETFVGVEVLNGTLTGGSLSSMGINVNGGANCTSWLGTIANASANCSSGGLTGGYAVVWLPSSGNTTILRLGVESKMGWTSRNSLKPSNSQRCG